MTVILVKNAVGWISFILRAIINGLFRTKCLLLFYGQNLALPLSVIFRALIFPLLGYTFLPLFAPQTLHPSLMIFLLWIVMAILPELLFYRMIALKPWKELFQAHNSITGNLWVFVLDVNTTSSVPAEKFRGLKR
jgi:hypothetical protein